MIKTETIIYYDEAGNPFEGKISRNEEIKTTRPGILIAHAYKGLSAFEEEKSRKLAELGYVAFAIDLYGQGRRATEPQEASKLMNELNSDRPLLLKRIRLALTTMKEQEFVDPTKIAAIGFCFGGKCVLDLARSVPEDLKGVVSFHGLYDPPGIKNENSITASVLVLHGWEDPLATPEQMHNLADELTTRNADWQIHAFGKTAHAFSNPLANDQKNGLFFQPDSDRRAWKLMSDFFSEIF